MPIQDEHDSQINKEIGPKYWMRNWLTLFESIDRIEPLIARLHANNETQINSANYLTDIRPAPMKWLANFTYDAQSIATHGFTQGSPLDVPDWAYTNGVDFSEPGYNFSIDITDENDIDYWGVNAHEAVIFRAAGVATGHYDGFNQTIFWGEDAVRPFYVIKCVDDTMGSPADHDFKIIQIDGTTVDGFESPLYDVLDYIENTTT